MDTSGWFESQLPPAADQREAKIELSSILDVGPPVPGIPAAPPLSQVTEELRPDGGQQPPPQ
jgi:hypothetical protein